MIRGLALLVALVMIGGLLVGTPVSARGPQAVAHPVTARTLAKADRLAAAGIIAGRYIVVLDSAPAPVARKGTNRTGVRRVASMSRSVESAAGIRVGHRFGSAIAGFSARLSVAQVRRLKADPRVASVVPDRRVHATDTILLPDTGDALTDDGHRAASEAQTIPTGVRRIAADGVSGPVDADIAIVDTGIGRAADQTMGGELNVVGGVDCTGNDDQSDHFGHGTHVAGIAAAVDNDMGTVGVAPGARLWSVRVLDENASGSESDVICGLDWLTAKMAATGKRFVINMSLGEIVGISREPQTCAALARAGTAHDPLEAAICRAQDAGGIVVVAAGNEGWPVDMDSPARYRDVVTVTALSDTDGEAGSHGKACLGRDDAEAEYSNFGAGADVMAPGSCIRSTSFSGVGETVVMSGTSMAAPHVAGAIARYLDREPGISRQAITSRLVSTGNDDYRETWDLDDTTEPLISVAGLLHRDGGPGFHVYPTDEIVGIGASRTAVTHLRIDRGDAHGTLTAHSTGNPTAMHLDLGDSVTGSSSLVARITFARGAEDRTGFVHVRVTDGDREEVVSVPYRFDTKAPAVRWDWPARGFQLHARVPTVATCISVIDHSDVRDVRVQRRTGGAPWKTLSRSDGLGGILCPTSPVTPGTTYDYRVIATDVLGNRRIGHVQRLTARSASISSLGRSGSWRVSPSGDGLTGRAGARATLTFDARSMAILVGSPEATTRLRIRIDGRTLPNDSGLLTIRKGHSAGIPFTSDWDGSARHTLSITVLSGAISVRSVLTTK